MKEINKRVKQIRQTLDIKQKDMAKILLIRQSSLSDIENGRVNVTERVMSALCKEFGVNINWLKTGEGDIFLENNTFSLDEFAKQKGATALELEIMKIYFSIDPNTRKDLLNKFKLAVLEDENLNQDNEEEDLVQTLPDEILRDIEWTKLNKENLQNKSNTDMEVKNKDA